MKTENNKIETIELKEGKSKPKPVRQHILGIIAYCLMVGFVLGAWAGISLSYLEIEEEYMDSLDVPVCKQQYNETKDKHTATCCETCNKANSEYVFDVQYQRADKIIDVCRCYDTNTSNYFNAWSYN